MLNNNFIHLGGFLLQMCRNPNKFPKGFHVMTFMSIIRSKRGRMDSELQTKSTLQWKRVDYRNAKRRKEDQIPLNRRTILHNMIDMFPRKLKAAKHQRFVPKCLFWFWCQK